MQTRSLKTIQDWMQRVITHPGGVSAGVATVRTGQCDGDEVDDAGQLIHPSSEMTPLDRLQIYGRAYFGRLLECLRAQFPAVRHALGDEAFDGLALGYLVDHPSVSYTLTQLGSSFDEYLSNTRPVRTETNEPLQPDFADFLIDLARLERVYSEVFDGPGPERLQSRDAMTFVGVSPEDFANSTLILHSCVRLLELQFPVHEYSTSIRKGIEPASPVARPILLVVTRRDYLVRRFEVTRPQFELLLALQQEMTVGAAIERMCSVSNHDIETLKGELQSWFHDWSAAPLFSELRK